MVVLLVACQGEGVGTETAVPTTELLATAVPPPEIAPTAVPPTVTSIPLDFDGENALAFVETQMAFGPRWPGSPGHADLREYIITTLTEMGWSVEQQRFDYQGFEAMNIIAKANEGVGEPILLGAHYDTRRLADETEGAVAAELPVPGAVDGASGVAVLLELARTLDLADVPNEVWLAFFDIEDNGRGGLPDWDYIAGSTYMAENLTVEPTAVVVVDMVGDADQQLYYEGNSHIVLRQRLWRIAADLGYSDTFIPEVKYTMIDDHLPFAKRNIWAVDIIDFDYLYWHTTADTADKVSSDSLLRVGHTLEVWLEEDLDSND